MIDSIKAVSFDPLDCQKRKSEPERKNKKQQFISQMEGEFYCTYVINETGKKILISKIPIVETEKENVTLEGSAFEKIKNLICHNNKNSEETTKNKEQITTEASLHSTNQEMMEILNSSVGIPNQSESKKR